MNNLRIDNYSHGTENYMDHDLECYLTDYEDQKEKVYVIPYTTVGDYNNSCFVELSNFQVLMEIPYIYDLSCNFGYCDGMAGFIPSELTIGQLEEIKEILDNLSNYPLLDDDHYQYLEAKKLSEQIENSLDEIGQITDKYCGENNRNDYEVIKQAVIECFYDSFYDGSSFNESQYIYFNIEDIEARVPEKIKKHDHEENVNHEITFYGKAVPLF